MTLDDVVKRFEQEKPCCGNCIFWNEVPAVGYGDCDKVTYHTEGTLSFAYCFEGEEGFVWFPRNFYCKHHKFRGGK